MELENKKILDVTCGGRSIWFNKNHPSAVYCDERDEEFTGVFGTNPSERHIRVHPDIQCSFTDLPFEDDTFSLVVFDPPHLCDLKESSWLKKEYGVLGDGWESMLHKGFSECMRVLKPDGVLVFKWAETQIPTPEIIKVLGQRPLFGHHSGKKSNTNWMCFMKEVVICTTQSAE